MKNTHNSHICDEWKIPLCSCILNSAVGPVQFIPLSAVEGCHGSRRVWGGALAQWWIETRSWYDLRRACDAVPYRNCAAFSGCKKCCLYFIWKDWTKNGAFQVTPKITSLKILTGRKVPKLGLMLVGWGGNNGSTLTAALEANRNKLEWRSKNGIQQANW